MACVKPITNLGWILYKDSLTLLTKLEKPTPSYETLILFNKFSTIQKKTNCHKIDSESCTQVRGATHRFFEANKCTYKGERNGNAKPQCQDSYQCAERDGSRWALHPQNQIHQEEISKHNSMNNVVTYVNQKGPSRYRLLLPHYTWQVNIPRTQKCRQ